MSEAKQLVTRGGLIQFPAYIPVTTFGEKYPLDDLVRPYLPRLAPAIMVSKYYAVQMTERPPLPVFVDSGGFASLFKNARVTSANGLGVIKLKQDDQTETIHPREVLEFQEEVADVAFTLDFPIAPGATIKTARRLQKLTIQNAKWALANRRRRDMPLYACIQAWDEVSASNNAKAYEGDNFDGIAIGGLVPRARNKTLITQIVAAVREIIPELPLHVFGLGSPTMVSHLYSLGVDSVDSSSYVQLAAQGILWGNKKDKQIAPSPTERLHIALCNLAMACGTALPLSMSGNAYRSHALRVDR